MRGRAETAVTERERGPRPGWGEGEEVCVGVVFIAQERGPKSNLRFPLGCNWKESQRSGGGGGRAAANTRPECRMALIRLGARRVTSGASPQVPFPFLSIWKPSPRHFGVGKGSCAGPAPHHFGASGVTFRLAGTSLGQRMPQCSQPFCLHLPSTFTSMIFAISLRAVALDEGGKDAQSAGVEVGRGDRWD